MAHTSKGMESYDLERFIHAQESTYATARAELAAGQKRSHWMWFIFPQIRGLGSSSMAQRYAIASLAEAVAYLQHEVLGRRLVECVSLVNAVEGRDVSAIFGYPDDLKFHSSVTLFQAAAEHASLPQLIFDEALTKYFAGRADGGTVALLR